MASWSYHLGSSGVTVFWCIAPLSYGLLSYGFRVLCCMASWPYAVWLQGPMPYSTMTSLSNRFIQLQLYCLVVLWPKGKGLTSQSLTDLSIASKASITIVFRINVSCLIVIHLWLWSLHCLLQLLHLYSAYRSCIVDCNRLLAYQKCLPACRNPLTASGKSCCNSNFPSIHTINLGN